MYLEKFNLKNYNAMEELEIVLKPGINLLIIDNLQNKEEMEEYVGVKLYYFKKKYDSLVKRGL